MLTLVPTPIGNLDDLSFRSLKTLQSAELIFCEDTRVTKKLLHLLEKKYQTTFDCNDFRSLHHHNEHKVLASLHPQELIDKNVAYVSDAGMPCISDPGANLVQYCIEKNISYDVLPGANAILTAFAMSGFEHTAFTFFGFLPHKGKERQQKLSSVIQHINLAILYESPHRLAKLLEELNSLIPLRTIFLAKELTKLHQNSFKGTAQEIYKQFQTHTIKGEWVVIIEPIASLGQALDENDILELDLPPKQKAKLLAKLSGKNTKEIYNTLI
ncbi:MAG: 16S rRNA (cytidine(1402)-2'-O)-methyltransferase [Campylobacterota bacterium]|nr:16S rRNA (cytidine(1402)-2'-O)-methyltransferase [Campylobacterota bacterium]